MKIQKFLVENPESDGPLLQSKQLLLREEIYVVGTVDGLRNAENDMGGWSATSKSRAVLYVVDAASIATELEILPISHGCHLDSQQ